MEVKLLSGALGAEIKGIDLKDTSEENFNKINEYYLFDISDSWTTPIIINPNIYYSGNAAIYAIKPNIKWE